jgi:hypothetical protein
LFDLNHKVYNTLIVWFPNRMESKSHFFCQSPDSLVLNYSRIKTKTGKKGQKLRIGSTKVSDIIFFEIHRKSNENLILFTPTVEFCVYCQCQNDMILLCLPFLFLNFFNWNASSHSFSFNNPRNYLASNHENPNICKASKQFKVFLSKYNLPFWSLEGPIFHQYSIRYKI